MNIKIKSSFEAFLVVLPIIFIEGRELDRITLSVVAWTFVSIYFSLKISANTITGQNNQSLFNSLSSLFLLLSYLTAAVDVRFLHIGDRVPIGIRYKSAVFYVFFTFTRIFLYSFLTGKRSNLSKLILTRLLSYPFIPSIIKGTLNFFISIRKQLTVSLIYLVSSISIIPGQLALKSYFSLYTALPYVVLILAEIVRFNITHKRTVPDIRF